MKLAEALKGGGTWEIPNKESPLSNWAPLGGREIEGHPEGQGSCLCACSIHLSEQIVKCNSVCLLQKEALLDQRMSPLLPRSLKS